MRRVGISVVARRNARKPCWDHVSHYHECQAQGEGQGEEGGELHLGIGWVGCEGGVGVGGEGACGVGRWR